MTRIGIHQLPELPASSRIQEELRAPHYVDVFAVSLDPARYPTMKEVLAEFDRRPPWWLRVLSAMRDFAAKRLRLKRVRLRAAGRASTGAPPARKRLKSFELYRDEKNEVVFGLDDRHLDFRSSLLIDEGPAGQRSLVLSTLVHFHNALGRMYFAVVRPFHRVLMRWILRRYLRGQRSGSTA